MDTPPNTPSDQPDGDQTPHTDGLTRPGMAPVAQRRKAEPTRGTGLFGLPHIELPPLPPWVGRWSLRGLLAGTAAGYLTGMGLLGWVVTSSHDMPTLAALTERSRPVSIQIVDRYGRDLVVRGANEAGDVKIDRLPRHVRDAVLAVEDQRFNNHIGVDAEGILRAAVANLRSGRRGQGGSTLTQQLVKNVFLTPEKTYSRKIQEALLAVSLERAYTKDEILEMYLERVYFGSGTWGISAASQNYFDLPPEELSLGQAAMLAGLLKAPSSYNPIADPSRAGERAALVLGVMEDQRRIDRTQRADALRQPLSIRPPSSQRGTNYFADWIWQDLENTLGIITTDIVVQTTLDADLQGAAELAVHNHLDVDKRAEQAAVVTLDRVGGVLAMVGGASYADSQFNRATQAVRQPGSSFKPFVYLSAFEAGLSPWDYRIDAPLDIDGWQPKNFGDRYYGYVTLEEAFGKSLNTVAVGLSQEVGADRVVTTASRFGLEKLQPLRSIGLGAQGTTPITMTAAYLPFGNWGERYEPFGILSVSTTDGQVIYQTPPRAGRRVIARGPLGDINRLMTRTVEQGTGTRARVPGHAVAGKTGTTNESRDAWFVGVSPGFATGVWVGNDANDPMKNITGGSIPAKIFADVMGAALMDQPRVELPVTAAPIWLNPTDRSLDVLLSEIEGALP